VRVKTSEVWNIARDALLAALREFGRDHEASPLQQ